MTVDRESVFLGVKWAVATKRKGGDHGKPRRGSIFILSLVIGPFGASMSAAYGAAGGGVRMLKSVAIESAKEAIRVNTVHPRLILTNIRKDVANSAEYDDGLGHTPMGHMGVPLNSGDMNLFLASDEPRYVTGAKFVFDPGITANCTSSFSRRRSQVTRRDRLVMIILPSLLTGCAGGVLDPQGPVGHANRMILLNSLGIMLVIVVPVIVATLLFAWWFRKGNARAVYRPDWMYSGQIELVIWAVPAMVVLLLSSIAWIGSHYLEPSRPLASPVKPIEVQVVSLDWKWLFIYPDLGIATVNRLVVPVGTPIHFRLTSASVMNSFFVPQLGSQIYTMAGMSTHLHLQADRPGRYAGISAQYSGAGFADMKFTVEAVAPSEFKGWAGRTRGRRPSLDAATYARLAGRSSAVAPVTYGEVAPGLFDAVVMMRAPEPDRPVRADGRTRG